ncbi:reverse transcriptase [Cucumis melo var. makuwa]|uniref:Reverse transcriptase n=1 Tax=Cucumis melo var. makuwa TaxID=1194695 RepID=A0A5A7U468_CUCMM|nr:reverse transcriptase [Cucumis melo var. makuwa]TYK07828.1 reverse transcriptase [Cucumis melo var. makuwa]
MENPTEPCTNNTMSENDKSSDVDVLENMEKKNRGDETEFKAFTASLDSTIILKNIYTALEYSEWKNAVMEEMKTLEKNKTWEICILPKGHKTVGCKWMFSLKYKADGTLDRHKARLVAKGFTQTYGIDYSETFSSVAKLNTVRVLLSVAMNKGYSQGHSGHTLFTKVFKIRKIIILIVYVDDIVLTGDDQTEISQLKQRMGDEFEIKDLGNLKYFLGMEVARSKEGISVSQRKYTLDLLTETGMLGCRPADTSIEFNCKLGNSDNQVPIDKEHQRLVGSVVDRKSTSGYCTFVWGNLITWRSKKQSIVARSSAEIEYRAMSLGICEEIWLQKVLSDLHQECETPLKLFCDNKAAISIANNPVQHDRTKHVEIDWHFIKERLNSGSICIPYIPSSQ